MVLWHLPQVEEMLKKLMVDSISPGGRMRWAVPPVEWQSLQEAAVSLPPAVALPCTPFW